MNKKIVLIALVIVIAIVMLSGCKQAEPAKEAVASPVTSATIKDSADREIRIPENLKRVIVLNSATYNMITAIGAADTVIGVSESIKKTGAASVANKEVFGSYMDPNIEKIVAARPDLVVDNRTMKPAQLKQLEDAGITVAFFEFYLPSILQDEISTLGKLFGKEEQAQNYINFITKYRNLIENRVKDVKPENKVTVYFEGYSDYSTVAKGTGGEEMIAGAGGINISGQEKIKYPKVSAEWVLQKNPQVIIKTVSVNNLTMGEGLTDKTKVKALYDSVISRTGWNELSAVKNNKVVLLAQDIGTTPDGSIIGMLYMAKTMYPDRFSDIDPYEVYKQMKKEFYQVEANGIIVYP